MKRSILWISAVVVVVAIGVAVYWFSRKPAESAQPAAATAPAAATDAAAAPNSTPKPGEVLLVEYSDFQCPSCAVMFPLVRSIHEEFNGRVDFLFREFPLKQIHANSERAAWAAEAAGQQGKFWEMADLLFKSQPSWSVLPNPQPAFEQYARSLGIDVNKFKADMDGFVVRSKVENDVRMGLADHVQHTPTVLLNGQEIRPRNYSEFRGLINEALARSRAGQ